MNIFFLDFDTKKCAEYHCDKHVVKMILETAQLLCSTHWVIGSEAPYKLSHKNHPCSIWVRESLSNYLYLCDLGLELCKEYTYRYGKRHKSQDVIEWCLTNKPNISDKEFTEPPKAMPDEYKVNNVIESYRNYYIGAKKDFAKWKNRNIPEWFSNKYIFM
jgi:hypothetical protein|tara:strand:+ start:49 stop:528 length:480 start_codon:yes stop_codon:yes gene_type:complete